MRQSSLRLRACRGEKPWGRGGQCCDERSHGGGQCCENPDPKNELGYIAVLYRSTAVVSPPSPASPI